MARPLRHQRRRRSPRRSPRPSPRCAASVAVPIGIHTHNDCELAVANTLAAVAQGATQVQGTINGIGERCGNVDLCSVIANLALKYPGYEVLAPGKLAHLTEVSRYVYETANMNFRPGQPFVGTSAFAHKGGMHVHGVRKNASSYEHIDPSPVGNERRVLVSELSGKSNIAEKLGEYGLEQDPELLTRVLDRVQDLENEGYQFEAAEASFVLLVEKLAGRYAPRFERLGYHVSVAGREADAPVTEATVKVRIGDAIEHTVSEGDGPVNALDGALRKALERHYPRPERDAPGRLQGPRHQRPRRDRRAGPRRDREQGRRLGLGHRRRLRERDRGELAGPGRRLRAQAGQGRAVCSQNRYGRSDPVEVNVVTRGLMSQEELNPYSAPKSPGAADRPTTLWPLAHYLLAVLTGLIGVSGLVVSASSLASLAEPIKKLGAGGVLIHPWTLRVYAFVLISILFLAASIDWIRHRWRRALVLSALPFGIAMIIRLSLLR